MFHIFSGNFQKLLRTMYAESRIKKTTITNVDRY